MKVKTSLNATLVVCCALCCDAVQMDYPLRGCRDAKATAGFWFDRLETNRTATLSAVWRKCSETPRIANFVKAANREGCGFGGIPYDDSDVYKVMEGSAYILAVKPDAGLMERMERLVGQVAKAQEPDGYLYTARTLGFNYGKHKDGRVNYGMMGPTRWSNLESSHELYNLGHMYEAAVAWYEATGRRDFLDVAIRSADLLDRTFGFGPTQLKDVPGCEEIELALCKLYRATGECRYLALAKTFLDLRGRSDLRKTWNASLQDHMPVVEQREALGHAVRAAYLYSGMADVAALAGDAAYGAAVDALWENVTGKKLHVTGGIGGHRHIRYANRKWGEAYEAFGENYDLPNDHAYLETCAAIANALFNQRMFLRHGDSKYVDVLERILYNGFLSGISLSGDRFFYQNPLASKGGYKRVQWFTTSCCPVNDVRFLPQVPRLAFAAGKGTVYWNLFMEGEASVVPGGLPDVKVRLVQKTVYPKDGNSELTVDVPQKLRFTLKVRVPGWARGKPVPGDLYVQTKPSRVEDVALFINGEKSGVEIGGDGYVSITREWISGDKVVLALPMPVKRIRAHANVAADRGRLAVERGPLVFCAEGVDNGGKAHSAALPESATFENTEIAIGDKTFPALKASTGLMLVPYCIWGNRQPGNDLQTWFK